MSQLARDLVLEASQNGIAAAVQTIDALDEHQMESLLLSLEERAMMDGSAAGAEHSVCALLKVLACAESMRDVAFMKCIDLIATEQISTQQCFGVLSELHLGVKLRIASDQNCLSFLQKICDKIIHYISNVCFVDGTSKVIELLPTVLHTAIQLEDGNNLVASVLNQLLQISWPWNIVLSLLDALLHSPITCHHENILALKVSGEHSAPQAGDITAIVRAMLGFCERSHNLDWGVAVRNVLHQAASAVRADAYMITSLSVKQSVMLAKLLYESIGTNSTTGLYCCSDFTLLVTVGFADLQGPHTAIKLIKRNIEKAVKRVPPSTIINTFESMARSPEMESSGEQLIHLSRVLLSCKHCAAAGETIAFQVFLHHLSSRHAVVAMVVTLMLERLNTCVTTKPNGNNRVDGVVERLVNLLVRIASKQHVVAEVGDHLWEWLPHILPLPVAISEPLLWAYLPSFTSRTLLHRTFILLKKEANSTDAARRQLAISGLCRLLMCCSGDAGEQLEAEASLMLMQGLKTLSAPLVSRSLTLLISRDRLSKQTSLAIPEAIYARFSSIHSISGSEKTINLLGGFHGKGVPLQDYAALLLPLCCKRDVSHSLLLDIAQFLEDDSKVMRLLSQSFDPSTVVKPGVLVSTLIAPLCHVLAIGYSNQAIFIDHTNGNACHHDASWWLLRAAALDLVANLLDPPLPSNSRQSSPQSVATDCVRPTLICAALRTIEESTVSPKPWILSAHLMQLMNMKAFSWDVDGSSNAEASSSSLPVPISETEMNHDWTSSRWTLLGQLLQFYEATHQWKHNNKIILELPDVKYPLIQKAIETFGFKENHTAAVTNNLYYKMRGKMINMISIVLESELRKSGSWEVLLGAAGGTMPMLTSLASCPQGFSQKIVDYFQRELREGIPETYFIDYVSFIESSMSPGSDNDTICNQLMLLLGTHKISQPKLIHSVVSLVANKASSAAISAITHKALQRNSWTTESDKGTLLCCLRTPMCELLQRGDVGEEQSNSMMEALSQAFEDMQSRHLKYTVAVLEMCEKLLECSLKGPNAQTTISQTVKNLCQQITNWGNRRDQWHQTEVALYLRLTYLIESFDVLGQLNGEILEEESPRSVTANTSTNTEAVTTNSVQVVGRNGKGKQRIHSRNPTVNRWLGEELERDDAYADLEDFIVPADPKKKKKKKK